MRSLPCTEKLTDKFQFQRFVRGLRVLSFTREAPCFYMRIRAMLPMKKQRTSTAECWIF